MARTAEERRQAAAAYAASRQGSGNSGYEPTTSAGRSSTSSGYGAYNATPRDEYWGDPNYSVVRPVTTPSGMTLNSGYYLGTSEGYNSYRQGRNAGAGAGLGNSPYYGGGGGGGGRGGGGGGGGGAPPMTQAMLDAMLKALGARGPQLNLSQVDLPNFQGTPLGPFNAQPYTQALGQLNTAQTRDLAASNAAAQQATQALGANYTNAYQQAQGQVQSAPAAEQVGTNLQQTAGGGGNQAAVAAESNAAAGSDQASFANLLNVLAAADQQAQSSRLNQVALDRGTAARGINAQALGLRGGINMGRAQAQNQWQQAAAERAYQNSLMQQQWQREEMMRNQDITNQGAQANWQQNSQLMMQGIQPLLDMIVQGGGAKLDLSGLQGLFNQWAA